MIIATYPKIFYVEILVEISLKILENRESLVYYPSNHGHVTGPRTDRMANICE